MDRIKIDSTISSNAGSVETLVAQIRQLLELEYKRGANDSLQTLARILGREGDQELAMGLGLGLDLEQRASGGRVPRGSARAFVERALTDAPVTIAELRSEAKTKVEKQLSYQTVRLELERGKKEKRYKKASNGKWSTT